MAKPKGGKGKGKAKSKPKPKVLASAAASSGAAVTATATVLGPGVRRSTKGGKRGRRLCHAEGCSLCPSFGFEGDVAVSCSHHKQPGMRNLTARRCQHPDCFTVANFGLPGLKPGFCAAHSTAGMVNRNKPRGVENSLARGTVVRVSRRATKTTTPLPVKPEPIAAREVCGAAKKRDQTSKGRKSPHRGKAAIAVGSQGEEDLEGRVRVGGGPAVRAAISVAEGEVARVFAAETKGRVDRKGGMSPALGRRQTRGRLSGLPRVTYKEETDDEDGDDEEATKVNSVGQRGLNAVGGDVHAMRDLGQVESARDLPSKEGKAPIESLQSRTRRCRTPRLLRGAEVRQTMEDKNKVLSKTSVLERTCGRKSRGGNREIVKGEDECLVGNQSALADCQKQAVGVQQAATRAVEVAAPNTEAELLEQGKGITGFLVQCQALDETLGDEMNIDLEEALDDGLASLLDVGSQGGAGGDGEMGSTSMGGQSEGKRVVSKEFDDLRHLDLVNDSSVSLSEEESLRHSQNCTTALSTSGHTTNGDLIHTQELTNHIVLGGDTTPQKAVVALREGSGGATPGRELQVPAISGDTNSTSIHPLSMPPAAGVILDEPWWEGTMSLLEVEDFVGMPEPLWSFGEDSPLPNMMRSPVKGKMEYGLGTEPVDCKEVLDTMVEGKQEAPGVAKVEGLDSPSVLGQGSELTKDSQDAASQGLLREREAFLHEEQSPPRKRQRADAGTVTDKTQGTITTDTSVSQPGMEGGAPQVQMVVHASKREKQGVSSSGTTSNYAMATHHTPTTPVLGLAPPLSPSPILANPMGGVTAEWAASEVAGVTLNVSNTAASALAVPVAVPVSVAMAGLLVGPSGLKRTRTWSGDSAMSTPVKVKTPRSALPSPTPPPWGGALCPQTQAAAGRA
ncbi:unnamed protein product [Choristocarpus tenellus]